jgi:malate dehydrogenase (oxaloacetate-decarboxylating)
MAKKTSSRKGTPKKAVRAMAQAKAKVPKKTRTKAKAKVPKKARPVVLAPVTKDELLARAYQPMKDAMAMHPWYRGKIEVVPKCVIRNFDDFGIWYSPGVSEPCMDIHKHPEKVYEHTNKGNMVAVVSDGSRVLGLGDIGPAAAMPVMEGKAILYKYLGGVDAFPICLATKDPEEIIQAVKWMEPTFGGINLEDIAKPKCFYILERLRKECGIPVWHDDQQGTATVTVAGLINALKIVKKKMAEVRVAMFGAGASNVRIAHLLIAAGVEAKKIIMCDTKGILHHDRTDIQEKEPDKWALANMTNAEDRRGGPAEAIKGADVLIALSTPGPGIVRPEWIKTMAEESVVFICANPIPECWPWEAKEAGARVVATGRSDFPNQVNNSLGFPGIFRGTLDVMARTITDEMCLAAAHELAKCAEDKGLREDYIIPNMDEWEVFPREAAAVGTKAVEQGVARIKKTYKELLREAENIIGRTREQTQWRMKKGFIKPYHK